MKTARSFSGRMLSVAWSTILAFVILLVGQGVWGALLVTNLSTTPAIPWAPAAARHMRSALSLSASQSRTRLGVCLGSAVWDSVHRGLGRILDRNVPTGEDAAQSPSRLPQLPAAHRGPRNCNGLAGISRH
jgi:hypothetical protein